jgi:hypothetical protein
MTIQTLQSQHSQLQKIKYVILEPSTTPHWLYKITQDVTNLETLSITNHHLYAFWLVNINLQFPTNHILYCSENHPTSDIYSEIYSIS